MSNQYIIYNIPTPAGEIPKISSEITISDKLGAFKARWGANRMKYRVLPGVYAIGNPNPDSPVFVSANYKLSFDILRRELKGLDAWIMVLDTKGINVWCAAGKGTFGTFEIMRRIEITGLKKIVNHRELILPQLGAPGVIAHKVKRQTDFSIIYGPVRAQDIKAFMKAGKTATKEMRTVRFSFYDRLLLVPMEIVSGLKYLLIAIVGFLLLGGLSRSGYSTMLAANIGMRSIIALLTAYFSGTVFGPLLLPYLPGRSFSVKGAFLGVLGSILMFVILFSSFVIPPAELIAWLLLIPAISSFILMNFTGASTYTSLSGVKKEMRIAVPVQAISGVLGLILWIIGRFA